jgi:hypothetical protein
MASWRRILTPYDIALGVLILAAGIISLQWIGATGAASAGTLRVEIDGRTVREITFQASDPARLIAIDAPRGEITIELTQGMARVLPLPVTTCPIGICWRSGWTANPAKVIVCLPNRMVVRILKSSSQVDGITR